MRSQQAFFFNKLLHYFILFWKVFITCLKYGHQFEKFVHGFYNEAIKSINKNFLISWKVTANNYKILFGLWKIIIYVLLK